MVTRPDAPAGRGRTLRRSPVAALRRRARARGAHAREARATPSSSRGCASSPRTAARSSPTARSSRARRWTSRGTAGSTCTSRCCPPGAARRRCSTRSGTATTSPAPRRFLLEEGLDTGPVLGVVTETDPPHRHQRRPARAARRRAAPVCSSRRWTRSSQGSWPPRAQPADGVSLAPKITVEDARVDWSQPAVRGRPPGARLHPGTRRLDDVPRRAAQARTGADARRRRRARARRARGRQGPGARRHRDRTPSCSARSAPQGKKPMAAADWARGTRPEPGTSWAHERRGPEVPPMTDGPRGHRTRPVQWRPDRKADRPLASRGVRHPAGGRPRRRRTPTSSRQRVLADADLHGRDAAFTTTLAYGTLRVARVPRRRARGLQRATARGRRRGRARRRCASARMQLLFLRTPPHAAVGETVQLARLVGGEARSKFVNAVLRRVGERDLDEWIDAVAPDPRADPVGHLAVVQSHPRWIVEALHDALSSWSGAASWGDTEDLLAADNVSGGGHPGGPPGPLRRRRPAGLPGRAAGALVAVRGRARRRRPGHDPRGPVGRRGRAGRGQPARRDGPGARAGRRPRLPPGSTWPPVPAARRRCSPVSGSTVVRACSPSTARRTGPASSRRRCAAPRAST